LIIGGEGEISPLPPKPKKKRGGEFDHRNAKKERADHSKGRKGAVQQFPLHRLKNERNGKKEDSQLFQPPPKKREGFDAEFRK